MNNQQPPISLLFPLYKSKPHLPNLLKQVALLKDLDCEIIFSDRHCYDDTIQMLQNAFQNDKRCSFLACHDELNWVGHYNLLMQLATGKYFCWVPHDDDYEPGYFSKLVAILDRNPKAVLAFGTMKVIGDTNWTKPNHSIFKRENQFPYSAAHYVRLLVSGLLGIAFRGVYLRAKILDKKLLICENEKVKTHQDIYWLFALILNGQFIFDESISCTKWFQSGTAHDGWNKTHFITNNPAALRLVRRYLLGSSLNLFQKTYIYLLLRTYLVVRRKS